MAGGKKVKNKITVIGSLNYDVILKVDRLPYKGETMAVDNSTFSAGGKGANQAVQTAKLKTPTYMVGCVGTDASADFLVCTAKQYGVDTRFIRKVEGSSGMGIIHALEDGSVYASIVRGANFQIKKEDIDKAMPALKESKVCILQNEIPVPMIEYGIDKAKEAGCIVVLNSAPAIELPDEYLAKVDILVVNEVEASFYCKETVDSVDKAKEEIKKLAEKYNNNVIITLGSLGAVVYENGTIEVIPAKKVDAVETTGAGDSYIGAVSHSIVEGLTLTEACRFATKCSAVTVCRCGAQPSMPTLEEVM